jgi:hypothetical protein
LYDKKRGFGATQTVIFLPGGGMTMDSILRIGSYKSDSTPKKLQRLKIILDKLEIPYVLDSISFHNTSYTVNRMKTVHNTRVWKVEEDGSVCLTNRFGHNNRFEYRYLNMPSPLEFQFVDLSSLSNEDVEFLSFLLFKADAFSYPQTTTGI